MTQPAMTRSHAGEIIIHFLEHHHAESLEGFEDALRLAWHHLLGPEVMEQFPGLALIIAERERQVIQEGWTAEHDDQHIPGDITSAGRAYALYAWWQLMGDRCGWNKNTLEIIIAENEWPWSGEFWKPSADPVRNLTKAGALIAAEIDRQLRQTRCIAQK